MLIHLMPNCGNSPKAEIIKNLTIAFAEYNLDEAMSRMDPLVTWTLVGEPPIQGVDEFRAGLVKMKDNSVVELSIHNIITHGKSASVNGEMKMKDGKSYGFADFYEFTSAGGKKVKEIKSYVLAL